MKVKKPFRNFSFFLLITAWLLFGWPPIWQNPRIPPGVQPALATAPLPAYRASGTFTAGTSTVTPPYPASMQANDICLLVVSSENQAITLTTANGFAELPTWSPQSAGTAATDPGSRLAVFWKRTVGGDSAPKVADSGNNTEGVIHCFSGVTTSGNPWDTGAGGNDSGANDTTGTIPGSTTTFDNDLVVLMTSTSFNGTSTAQCSGWTNANLANITERQDNTNTAGLGGGSCMATGEKATAGSYTTTTLTLANTTYKGAISLALKPPQLPAVSTQAASAVNETTATANGNITDAGGDTADKQGFVYDTSSHGLPGNVAPGSSGYASFAENTGSFGAGAFTVGLTGLSSGNTYYGRAYAHNSAGYSYGGEVNFTTAIISITITSDGSISYGIVPVSTSKDTTSSGLNDTQVASNNGSVAEDFNIKGQNSSGWTLAGSAGSEQYVHAFCTTGSGSPDPCDSSPTWTALTTSYQSLASNVAVSGNQRFDLKITMPTGTTATAQQSVDVTVQAVIH